MEVPPAFAVSTVAREGDAAELAPDLAAGLSLVRVVEYWLWALDLGFTEDPHRCRTLAGWLAPQFAKSG